MIFHVALVKTAGRAIHSSMINQYSVHTGELGCRVVFWGATAQGLTVAVVFSHCQKVES
jgi:hypothetical protein